MMTISRHKLFLLLMNVRNTIIFFRFLFAYSDVVPRSQPLRSLWSYMARKLVSSTYDVSSCLPLCLWLVLTCQPVFSSAERPRLWDSRVITT